MLGHPIRRSAPVAEVQEAEFLARSVLRSLLEHDLSSRDRRYGKRIVGLWGEGSGRGVIATIDPATEIDLAARGLLCRPQQGLAVRARSERRARTEDPSGEALRPPPPRGLSCTLRRFGSMDV